MKKLTKEQVAEAKRRLRLPQAAGVVAHHMHIPRHQVEAVAHSMRRRGRPSTLYADSADVVRYVIESSIR